MNTTMDKDSLDTLLMDDPGGDDTMDNKDKSDDNPPLSDKVNLDGSSTNDNPGSRDFYTPTQLASSNTKASRFSTLISVTKAPLNKLTDEVMNTTMDKDSHIAELWLTGMNGALRSYVHDCGG